MRTGPIKIDGIAAPLLIDTSLWTGKPVVTIDGVQIQSTGRRWFTLPASGGGTVEARITTSVISPYPTVEIAGVRHATGPELPTVLKVLILLPVVLVVGGPLSGLIGALAVILNMRISVWDNSAGVKAFGMIGVLMAAAFVWLMLVGALVGTGTA